MGVRFDRWLAQPSTLHFLRHLVGPEAGLSARQRPCRTGGVAQRERTYAAAAAQLSLEDTSSERQEARDKASNSRNTQWLLHRAAQELRLRASQTLVDAPTTPSATGNVQTLLSYHDQMQIQADVNSEALVGQLLIDQPMNISSMEAWAGILEFRNRVDGLSGVLDVWQGMQKRNVKLSTAGEHVDVLWITFIHSAITENQTKHQEWLLQQVYQHALEVKRSSDKVFEPLYITIVGRFLRVAPGPRGGAFGVSGIVLEWHQELASHGFFQSDMVRQLTLDVLMSTRKGAAFTKFQQIYQLAEAHSCYDYCMSLVLQHRIQKEAMLWHQFFVNHQDLPSDKLVTEPEVQLCLQLAEQKHVDSPPKGLGRKSQKAIHALVDNDASSLKIPLLTRASMSSLVGDVHGIKAKAISDNFCARMFATSAFSVDFVVRGLVFLNIELLGPMSLRELALRSSSPQKFQTYVADIRKAGIGVSDSMYSRILEKVVETSNGDLFNALLSSDQHPESYNDAAVQESLLSTFLEKQDWQQVHLTLLCLSQADRSMVGHAWNCLLRRYISVRDYREIARIMDYLRSEQIALSVQTVQHLMRDFLPRRIPSKRPVTTTRDGVRPLNFKSLDLVVNACMYQAQHGDYVPTPTWVELLKRYGMAHKMDRVERLALWLAFLYPKHANSSTAGSSMKRLPQGLQESRPRKADKLDRIFTDNMLEAIGIWGWRSASVRNQLRPLTPIMLDHLHRTQYGQSMERHDCPVWARGFLLLRRLKEAGVPVQQNHVRRAMQKRLWTMFGPGVSRRNVNVEAMRRNRLSPAHYVQTVDELWDEPIFGVPADMLQDSLESETRLLQRIFGRFRLTDRKTGTYADVDKWLMARAASGGRDAPRSQRGRRYRWAISPYRLHASTIRQQRSINASSSNAGFKRLATTSEHPTTYPATPLNSQQHPQPAAQPSNLHPQPTQLYTPVPP